MCILKANKTDIAISVANLNASAAVSKQHYRRLSLRRRVNSSKGVCLVPKNAVILNTPGELSGLEIFSFDGQQKHLADQDHAHVKPYITSAEASSVPQNCPQQKVKHNDL